MPCGVANRQRSCEGSEFETSVIIYQSTERNMPEDLKLQQCSCEKGKTKKKKLADLHTGGRLPSQGCSQTQTFSHPS